MADKMPAANVTDDIIAKWKQQYGRIAKIKFTEQDTQKVAFVRSPTNKEIDFAGMNLSRGALSQYGITLFNTCHLAGDTPITEDGLRSVGAKMSEMIEAVEVELEKL